jgi:hypothetical protein
MAIDKALYEAPQGLDALAAEEPAMDIEIEGPEMILGEVEISLSKERPTAEDFDANLAEYMSEN